MVCGTKRIYAICTSLVHDLCCFNSHVQIWIYIKYLLCTELYVRAESLKSTALVVLYFVNVACFIESSYRKSFTKLWLSKNNLQSTRQSMKEIVHLFACKCVTRTIDSVVLIKLMQQYDWMWMKYVRTLRGVIKLFICHIENDFNSDIEWNKDYSEVRFWIGMNKIVRTFCKSCRIRGKSSKCSSIWKDWACFCSSNVLVLPEEM